MRVWVTLLAICLLAACGKAPDDSNGEPDVNVTAAPGVAFSYGYAYTLPPANIARVQEAHAQACEKLGVARCRITGMRYDVASATEVSGELSFKLEPALARAFGRQGTQTVEGAEGMLSHTLIQGTDVGSEIDAANDRRRDADADRTRLDREIAAASPRDRPELIRQRAALDAHTRDLTTANRARSALLATTPVTFHYDSGAAIRSLHAASPLVRALDLAIMSLETTVSVVLQVLAILLPPALALALLWLAWRWRGRRWWRRFVGPDPEQP